MNNTDQTTDHQSIVTSLRCKILSITSDLVIDGATQQIVKDHAGDVASYVTDCFGLFSDEHELAAAMADILMTAGLIGMQDGKVTALRVPASFDDPRAADAMAYAYQVATLELNHTPPAADETISVTIGMPVTVTLNCATGHWHASIDLADTEAAIMLGYSDANIDRLADRWAHAASTSTPVAETTIVWRSND
jgi:hypothetical protein